MFDRSLMQRKADVRGVYPNQINEELGFFVGRCLVRALREIVKDPAPKVLVGRDGRVSSPAIYAAVIQGIAAEGGVPMPCGLATTDMIQWGTGEQLGGACAGAMITASHNPPEYNGIKMVVRNPQSGGLDIVSPGGHMAKHFDQLGDSGEAAVAQRLAFPTGPNLKLHERFVAAACLRAPRLAQAKGKIVLDPGNGVGGLFVPLLREALKSAGADVEVLAVAEQIDGTFPTRPSNPGLPGAVKLLQEHVRQSGAAFGAAFDGDADRVFLVDEWGTFVNGSLLIGALGQKFIQSALAQGRQKPAVIYSAVSSWLAVETIRKAGGQPVISRVGQDALKVALVQTEAVFGGESSAHYNFPDAYCLDSGLFALLAFWDLLLETGKTCSQLLGELQPWPASGEVNLRIESPDWKSMSKQVIAELTSQYSAPAANCYLLSLDGVGVFHPRQAGLATVDDLFRPASNADPRGEICRAVADGYTPRWWFNVRASNNEPLLRVNVEAQSAADVTGRSYSLISWIRDFCESRGAKVEVETWGNLG